MDHPRVDQPLAFGSFPSFLICRGYPFLKAPLSLSTSSLHSIRPAFRFETLDFPRLPSSASALVRNRPFRRSLRVRCSRGPQQRRKFVTLPFLIQIRIGSDRNRKDHIGSFHSHNMSTVNPLSANSASASRIASAARTATSSSSAFPTMPVPAESSYASASGSRDHHPQVDRDGPSASATSEGMGGQFDIFDWHPAYQSCQKYFLDHAQHEASVQAVAALVNISLPHQWSATPIANFTNMPSQPASPSVQFNAYGRQTLSPSSRRPGPPNWVSLIPFIRRLVITGFDRDPVLHGFFGDDWRKGIGPLQECERRNYLFAAKSGGWGKVKAQYDIHPYETVPFLQPPQNVQLAEIEAAEKSWSQWLALEDWMVGPRAPEHMQEYNRSEHR